MQKPKSKEVALKEFRFVGTGIICPAAACDASGIKYINRGNSFQMEKGDTAFFTAPMATLSPTNWQAVK